MPRIARKKKMSEFYLSARCAARTMRFEVYITLAKTCQNFGSTPQRIWKVFPKAQYALPPRDIRRNLRIFKIFLYFKFIKFSDYPYRRPRKKLISLRKARLKKTMDSKGGKKIAKNAQTAFCPVHFFYRLKSFWTFLQILQKAPSGRAPRAQMRKPQNSA